MEIQIQDTVEMLISKTNCEKYLKEVLTFKAEYFRDGRFHKIREEYDKWVSIRKVKEMWSFYIGHLPGVLEHCKKIGVEVQIIGDQFKIEYGSSDISGVTFRPDQNRLIRKCLEDQRGVIKAATGIGKTYLQMGLMKSLKGRKLLLCHTVDIIQQTVDELKDFGFKNVQMLGGGLKGKLTGDIVCATIQTFVKLKPTEYCDYFDVAIIDETHMVSSFSGQYAKVLSCLLAPCKLGFTGTLPPVGEPRLALEGLIGPLLGELSINEAGELGVLAKPHIKIVPVPINHKFTHLNYNEVYEEAVVNNLVRNNMIIDIIKENMEKGNNILVFVQKIKHGTNIRRLARNRGLSIPFVRGDMSKEDRMEVKKDFCSFYL